MMKEQLGKLGSNIDRINRVVKEVDKKLRSRVSIQAVDVTEAAQGKGQSTGERHRRAQRVTQDVMRIVELVDTRAGGDNVYTQPGIE